MCFTTLSAESTKIVTGALAKLPCLPRIPPAFRPEEGSAACVPKRCRTSLATLRTILTSRRIVSRAFCARSLIPSDGTMPTIATRPHKRYVANVSKTGYFSPNFPLDSLAAANRLEAEAQPPHRLHAQKATHHSSRLPRVPSSPHN